MAERAKGRKASKSSKAVKRAKPASPVKAATKKTPPAKTVRAARQAVEAKAPKTVKRPKVSRATKPAKLTKPAARSAAAQTATHAAAASEQQPTTAPFADFLNQFGGQFADNRFANVWQKYLQQLGSQPDLVAGLTQQHAERQGELLAELSSPPNGAANAEAANGRRDPRFAHEAWEGNPFYRYLKETYFLNSELLRQTSSAVELDSDDRRALDFMLEQFISALAPNNFPATNPEVIETTIESKGENLRRGAANYMQDAQLGAITQTDPDAFTIGANLAMTPGKVIAQNHLFQLIEYLPTTAKVNAQPLLIVPPCINKYYILDLAEKNSLVRHLVASGQRVLLVSWVNAGELQADITWDDYVAGGVLEALAITHEVCGGKPVHTLGYCIGGTLLSCALSVARAKRFNMAASMSLLTTMLDHCDTGNVGLFVDESFVKQKEEEFANGGIFDGLNLRRTFAYMRPDELVWPYVVRNYMLGETPPPFDILHWNADATNLPGRMYSWYLRHNYLDNDLITGEVEVCGSKVDYGNIDLPGMVVATERDHIVPWQAAYSSARLLSNEIDFVLASSGHVAGVVNAPERRKGFHMCAPTQAGLPTDAKTWQSKANKSEGSWWPRYFAWLDAHSGDKVAAPQQLGSSRYRPFEDAPGSYVSAPLPKLNN